MASGKTPLSSGQRRGATPVRPKTNDILPGKKNIKVWGFDPKKEKPKGL